MRCINCFEEYEDYLEVCPHCGYTEGDAPAEEYMLYAGTMLQDRYVVGQVLGFGGFGITYKAFDTKLERTVAIKEYYPAGLVYRTPGTREVVVFKGKHYSDYSNGLMRFLEEARSTTKFIDNPNIVDIMEFFEENGTAYFVMELLVGLPLNKFLDQCGGKIDTDAAISIVSCVGEALKAVHKEGYIHRDVAPDNIYMCDNGRVKLFDFGAAKFSAVEHKNFSQILKPGYAPTEQYETASDQGPWTDVYALGATMYRMITGVKPEESTNRKIADTVAPPFQLDSSISVNLSNAVMRAMAIEQHLRYRTVDEFIRAIKSEKKVASVETVKKRKKRFRWLGIAASLVVICIGATIFYSNWNRQKEVATLPDAKVSLWYIIEEGDKEESHKAKGMEQVTADFIGMYDNVSVECVAVLKDEYEQKLKQAFENNEAPEIFESTGINDSFVSESGKLGNLYNGIDGENSYFIDSCGELYSDKGRAPSSFVMPVVYVNTLYAQCGKEFISEFDDIESKDGNISCSVSPEWQEYYISSVKNIKDIQEGGLDAFITGKVSVYFGSSSDLEAVYEQMTGKCRHYTLKSSLVECRPGNTWSIYGAVSEDENKVAERFIEYLINDPTAQDYMYMQGDYGDKSKLPINKDAIYTLISDDAQFYKTILADIDNFGFSAEY